MKTNLIFLMSALFVFVLAGCGDDDPLDAAWEKFEDKAYAEAHTAFSSLVASKGSAALVGLGWTTLRMDSLPASSRYFGLAKDDSVVDGYAGWSFVLWGLEQYTESLNAASFSLRKKPRYVFSHDRTVTDEDLVLHQAYGYFHLGDYAACIQKIRMFDSTFPLTATPEQILQKLDQMKGIAG